MSVLGLIYANYYVLDSHLLEFWGHFYSNFFLNSINFWIPNRLSTILSHTNAFPSSLSYFEYNILPPISIKLLITIPTSSTFSEFSTLSELYETQKWASLNIIWPYVLMYIFCYLQCKLIPILLYRLSDWRQR